MVSIRKLLAGLFCLALVVIASGCTENKRTVTPVPASAVVHGDDAAGYTITTPQGWDVSLVNDTYISAKEQDGAADVLVWPVYRSGNYTGMTAIGLANYAIGRMASGLHDFNVLSMKKNDGDSVIEITANYTVNGTKEKGVMTAMVGIGSGMVTRYEAPEDRFAEKEPVMRDIISSFNITASPSLSGTQRLFDTTPQVKFALGYPKFDGAFTMSLPAGWAAFQRQVGETTADWWAVDQGNGSAMFGIYDFTALYNSSWQARQVEAYHNAGDDKMALTFASYPVIENDTTDYYLYNIFPDIADVSIVDHMTGLRIVRPHPVSDPARNSLLGMFTAGSVGDYTIAFDKNGTPMEGKIVVVTYRKTGSNDQWFADAYGYYTPESQFSHMEPTLVKALSTVKPTDAWQQHVQNYSLYRHDAVASIISVPATPEDALYEHWSDVVLDSEGRLNADAGKAYEIPPVAGAYFSRDSAMNLTPMLLEEAYLIPLDGQPIIR